MSRKFGRKYETRLEYKFIYIFTEGTKTEPNYFKSKKEEIEVEIRRRNIKIEIAGTARSTLSLIDYVLGYIKEEKIDMDINECWVVFDKDDCDEDFNEAIDRARANNLKVAYSNECFELWFLLHFDLLTSAIDRNHYKKKLDKEFKKIGENKYEKQSEKIYSLIKNKEKRAIKNAEKLLSMYGDERSFLKMNPSTTVHLLVKDLNELRNE